MVGGGCPLNGLFLLYLQLYLRYSVIKSKRQLIEIQKSMYANLVDIVLINECTAKSVHFFGVHIICAVLFFYSFFVVIPQKNHFTQNKAIGCGLLY